MRTILCFVVVIMAATAAVPAADADTIVMPSLAVGEEYNDNIFLVPKDQTADFITHVIPGIDAVYASPVWDWQLTYSYDRRQYAKVSYFDDATQYAFLKSTVRIVKELLFFEALDTAGRASTSAVQDYTKESPVKNQTNYNMLQLRPYAVFQLSSRTTLTTGYLYQNIWYEDPRAIDKTMFTPYGDISMILTEKMALNASVWHDRIETFLGTRSRMSVLMGPRYDYQEGSYLWGRIGPSRTTLGNNSSETYLIWDAGLLHRLTSRVTASFNTGRSWITDPYFVERREDRIVAAVRAEKERTEAGLSFAVRYYGTVRYYTDAIKYTTTADFSHFLLPRLQGKYAVTANRYEQFPVDAPDSITIVWQTDVRLDYYATENLTLSLSYQYTDSYAVNYYFSNYAVNSLMVFAKMTF